MCLGNDSATVTAVKDHYANALMRKGKSVEEETEKLDVNDLKLRVISELYIPTVKNQAKDHKVH
jgi:hypothetical protein